jgi:hypothetical protein
MEPVMPDQIVGVETHVETDADQTPLEQIAEAARIAALAESSQASAQTEIHEVAEATIALAHQSAAAAELDAADRIRKHAADVAVLQEEVSCHKSQMTEFQNQLTVIRSLLEAKAEPKSPLNPPQEPTVVVQQSETPIVPPESEEENPAPKTVKRKAKRRLI